MPSSPAALEPPPGSTTASAIRRHRLLVFACALVVAFVGVLGGMHRRATFTAAATLQVGKVNPNSPGFYGFVQSASDLATAFSRAVTAAPVLHTAGRKLGIQPLAAAGRLAAEPIPNSPAFRVIATGPTAASAVKLANVASTALIAYEAKANTYSPESARLLSSYRAAEVSLAQAKTALVKAEADAGSEPSAAGRLKVQEAEARKAAAGLRTQALAGGYQQSAQSATTRDLISMLSGAVGASSDRRSKIQLLGFVGLLGGLALGCTLAVLLDQRRARPRPAAR